LVGLPSRVSYFHVTHRRNALNSSGKFASLLGTDCAVDAIEMVLTQCLACK
jgi:hypothetical protein